MLAETLLSQMQAASESTDVGMREKFQVYRESLIGHERPAEWAIGAIAYFTSSAQYGDMVRGSAL